MSPTVDKQYHLFDCIQHLPGTRTVSLLTPQTHHPSHKDHSHPAAQRNFSPNSIFPLLTNIPPKWPSTPPPPPKKVDQTLQQTPGIQIFLQPIAPPAALGLAGFAGSTWITSSYIANWWGNSESPTIFFPFVGLFGGLAQFIAGLYGFKARDTLVTVINTMWGSFWISIGVLYAFVAAGALEPHEVHTHFPELASWFVILCVFTWSGALAATARDVVLSVCLFSLAIGSTIACCMFAYNGRRVTTADTSASGDSLTGGVTMGMKAASYFWMLSALCAWWRVTVYLVEEAYGPDHTITKFFPIGRTPMERRAPLVIPGLGEPGVKRGVPKPLPV